MYSLKILYRCAGRSIHIKEREVRDDFLYKKGILKVFVLFFCQKFHGIGLDYSSFIAPREYADYNFSIGSRNKMLCVGVCFRYSRLLLH
jgi:hypothetical protein